MHQEGFTAQHRKIGSAAAWVVSFLLFVYAVTIVLGLLSLQSPLDPIGDPYFTLMELLIILTVPLMVITMVVVHAYASPDVKACSLTALILMSIMAGITSCVHFVILTVSRQITAAGLAGAPLFFSFQWPSVVYTLDILAWDWFFALSMLFAAPVFKSGRLERVVRLLMIISGLLSLVGLIGVPLANMQIRNIGIIGYAGVALLVFVLLGIVFGRAHPGPDYSEPVREANVQ
ncbi:hypothetical protein JW964_00970 [candidate division KSB1 bacterium]|nr:hypothetical protein [candidate division KSB1 bacterium]